MKTWMSRNSKVIDGIVGLMLLALVTLNGVKFIFRGVTYDGILAILFMLMFIGLKVSTLPRDILARKF